MYNFMKHPASQNGVNVFRRCYSFTQKSHYDILRLRRSCTDKEIKEAFIALSKEFHPDKNKSANAQQHFVRIVEAYNVLGKPSSRAQYDRASAVDSNPYHRTYNATNMRQNSSTYGNTYYNFGARTSNTSHNASQSTYYGGTKGIKRVPTYVLVLLCFGIAFVGTVLQAIVIRFQESAWKKVQRNREMYGMQKRQALERSKLLSEEYDRVREAAQGQTNEEIELTTPVSTSKYLVNVVQENKSKLDQTHTRLLLDKIVGSANPTIATASLGHALATEKK